ncbi:hypothetical protein KCP69_05040 [Salmonella enterica subsp. enterica]|nr:hypothetical protein KCP69_05040 [Salmonella enterica subsp. enterica]
MSRRFRRWKPDKNFAALLDTGWLQMRSQQPGLAISNCCFCSSADSSRSSKQPLMRPMLSRRVRWRRRRDKYWKASSRHPPRLACVASASVHFYAQFPADSFANGDDAPPVPPAPPADPFAIPIFPAPLPRGYRATAGGWCASSTMMVLWRSGVSPAFASSAAFRCRPMLRFSVAVN